MKYILIPIASGFASTFFSYILLMIMNPGLDYQLKLIGRSAGGLAVILGLFFFCLASLLSYLTYRVNTGRK